MIASAAVHATAAAPPRAFIVPGGALAGSGELPGAPGEVPADLSGWTVRGGPGAVQPVVLPGGRSAARLSGNASLVTPPVAVDPRAQTVSVVIASGAGAVVDVVAEPVDGGAPVLLDSVEAPAAAAAVVVPVSAVRGRTVRLVLDPTAALGATLEVAAVGPLAEPLAGWTVSGGGPEVRAGTPGVLRLRDDPMTAVSPPFTPARDVRYLLAAVRGDGSLRMAVAGRAVIMPADPAWRDVRLPVVGGRPVTGLTLHADPDGGRIEIRDLGVAVRQVPVPAPVVRLRGRRASVAGSLGIRGAGLRVSLRDRGRTVAQARTDPAGRFRLHGVLGSGRPRAVLQVTGDRTRLGGVRMLRVR